MTLSSTSNRTSTDGDGSAVNFSFPYLFFNQDDLKVILVDETTNVETTQTITTHYTVTGAGVAAGGTVIMGTAPTTNQKLVIQREEQYTQTLDLVENDPFPSNLVEQQLDTLTMLTQQLKTLSDRAVKLSDGDFSGADPTLATPVADAFIKWDSAGTALENSSTTAGQWLGANGSAALPYYTFTSDPDIGMWRVGANQIGWSVNGVKGLDLSTTGLTITGELDAATLDISGDADIDGTTNLDAVDIDGNVQLDGTLSVGVDGTGKDVTLFGDTSGAHVKWDESADKLLTAGAAVIDIVKDKLLIGGSAVTTTAAELNILDGVTSTTAELNILGGVTSTTAELNILDGVTSTTAELNYSDTGAAVGTVVASKIVTADANKDVASLRNVTATGLITGGSLTLASGATITAIADEDNMASNSATLGVTQQSLVSYVTSIVTGAALWSDVAYKTVSDSPVAVADGDAGTMYAIDASGGAVVVNLAAISTLSLGGTWAVGFKKTDTSANTITINRAGSDTIDGGTSYILNNQAEGVTLIPDADGSPDNWTSIAAGPVFGSASVYQFTNTGSDSTASTTSNGGYNDGVSTTLTISQSPLSESNVHLLFDGVTQHHDTYTLSGAVITTSSAIPTGTGAVEVLVGETVAMGVPSDSTVTSAKLSGNLTTPGTLTVNGEATATGFTGTLDGILGSGTAAAASVTTLTTSGIASIDDTTDSTSGTTGSIHTDGGLGVVKDVWVNGDITVSNDTADAGTGAVAQLFLASAATPAKHLGLGFDNTNSHGYLQSMQTSVGWFPMEYDASSHIFKLGGTTNLTLTGSVATFSGSVVSVTAAKLWLNYNQITPAIVASYNVTSVGDTAAGIFNVVVATDFADALYSVVTGARNTGAANLFSGAEDLATTNFNIHTVNNNGSPSDGDVICVTVFGDQ